MSSIFNKHSYRSEIIFLTVITSFIFSPAIFAQQLEEIVVTAQRRVQSLQEVPISIQAVTGLELNQQGFRTMEDLGQFAPSVEMNESLHEHSVTIRGMGNDVAAMGVEQSAPIFVDGIHMGRPSMIKGAFMDLERVEILTGPQPVYFGQNATAGAFSLTTKGPSEAWEADATAEFGNFGRINFEGGIGGPVTDTFGIRIAGQWDDTGGHLTDAFTGNKFPNRTDAGFRFTGVWKPTENFTGTAKIEYARRRSDGDTNTVCITGNDEKLDNYSVLVPGLVPGYTDEIHEPANCNDGFSRVGVQEGTGTFPAPIAGINNDDGRSGLLDIREIAKDWIPEGNLKSREPLDSLNYRLGGVYEFDNGVSVEGIFGLVDYERDTFESTDESPFLMEAAFRTEVFDMHSGEIRFTGPSGGQFEWSAGAYMQEEKLFMDPVRTIRATVRQGIRIHHPEQASSWKSAFATVTFNFLDDKASIDVGGRYSDVNKEGSITAEYASWIFDEHPDPDGDGLIQSTEHRTAAAGGDRVREDNTGKNRGPAENIINCETGLTFFTGGANAGGVVRNILGNPVARSMCGQYFGQAGFWTNSYKETDTPDAWDTLAPHDSGGLTYGINGPTDNGPFIATYSENSFDPQITLRYRPSDNHSIYAKYATAFKAGGFDTSDRGIPRGGMNYPRANLGQSNEQNYGPDGQKEFVYLAENATVYEVGSKGRLFDGRGRYAVTLFYQKITDLQLETEIADFAALLSGTPATGRFLTNAGAQRNQGTEFSFGLAATDRLTLNVAGIIQDSIMLDFIGGCTEAETVDAANGPCWNATESADILGIPDGDAGSDALEGLIDRSGFKAPRAPAWKVILGAEYEMPLFDKFVGKFNARAAVSDSYTEDTLGFTTVMQWPVHTDLNILAGIGSADGTWDVNVFARNILGARQQYYPEFDDEDAAIITDDMPQSAWFNYGIQFNYHFR